MDNHLETPVGPVPAFPSEKDRVENMSDQELIDSLNNSAFVDPHELAEATSRSSLVYEHPGRGWLTMEEYRENPPERGFQGLVDSLLSHVDDEEDGN